MRVMNILHDSIVDGKGLRTVIFFAGCPHHCQGCHNPQSWNIKNGLKVSTDDLFQEVMLNELSNVTFSGGDPFFQAKGILPLAQKLKAEGKNIWCYTGYTFEELLANPTAVSLLREIDVLVDGRFDISKRDIALLYKGSGNQRIIDVPKSLDTGSIILSINQ